MPILINEEGKGQTCVASVPNTELALFIGCRGRLTRALDSVRRGFQQLAKRCDSAGLLTFRKGELRFRGKGIISG